MTDEQTPDPDSPEGRRYVAERAWSRMVEAIEDFERAQSAADVGGSILVDWTLVTASHFDQGDGSSGTAYGLWGPLELPAHRLLGLLDYGKRKAAARIDASERGGGSIP
jgi:hypothetical protein